MEPSFRLLLCSAALSVQQFYQAVCADPPAEAPPEKRVQKMDLKRFAGEAHRCRELMEAVGHVPAHGDLGDAATAPRLHGPKMARSHFQ